MLHHSFALAHALSRGQSQRLTLYLLPYRFFVHFIAFKSPLWLKFDGIFVVIQQTIIIFASALTKQRILKVLEEARNVYQNRTVRIPTARLNEEMLPLIEAYPPPSNKGKYIKIKYCTQLPNTQVPSFVFFANLPQYVKEPYRRFLENKMREKWNFSGTPINIYIRQK